MHPPETSEIFGEMASALCNHSHLNHLNHSQQACSTSLSGEQLVMGDKQAEARTLNAASCWGEKEVQTMQEPEDGFQSYLVQSLKYSACSKIFGGGQSNSTTGKGLPCMLPTQV